MHVNEAGTVINYLQKKGLSIRACTPWQQNKACIFFLFTFTNVNYDVL